MRKPIIAGNWKMNNTPKQAVKLIEELIPLVKDAKTEVVVCPTYVCLDAAVKAVSGTNIKIGAQNMHFEESGAYTGEISAEMLCAIGVDYVIIGHSERREYFAETDETVNKKLKAAMASDIIPIVCVGETLEQKEEGITRKLVEAQTKAAFDGLDSRLAETVIVAYEPIWAIGTGRTATPDDANQVIGFIRGALKDIYGSAVSEAIRIQYGGSMKPTNVAELMAMPEIDGGLVGGASLNADDFAKVIKY